MVFTIVTLRLSPIDLWASERLIHSESQQAALRTFRFFWAISCVVIHHWLPFRNESQKSAIQMPSYSNNLTHWLSANYKNN